MSEKTDYFRNNIRAIVSIGLTCLIGWLFSYLAIYVFEDYRLGLFIWLPLVMGVVSTVIYGFKNPIVKDNLRWISLMSLLIFALGMLIMAFEGVICLVMATPTSVFFNIVGYKIGRIILANSSFGGPSFMTFLFVFSVPVFMAFEDNIEEKDELRSISTTVDIKASPETVWKNVIEFPQLEEPKELIFKVGIAYPINAKIKGDGKGAIRYCNFSTGSFVEPITNWEEPKLLEFDVLDQPEPMKELSIYDIHPNHLHGFWISQKGQFKLTRLENGYTRLEGTTWYINKIKPDFYWTLWSDYIVHTIHERVLNHIKKESEN